jgi:hypothetical protein
MAGFQTAVSSASRTQAELDAERRAAVDAQREAAARVICSACDESPDHAGDAGGNAFRWQSPCSRTTRHCRTCRA